MNVPGLSKVLPAPADSAPAEVDERRLWIGNLDLRLSEYQLVKILQKIGSIEQFDMIFHRSGPLKGQARGYAFITYKVKEDALKAIKSLNGKKIGSKSISVKWAHSANLDTEKPKMIPDIPVLIGTKRKQDADRESTIQAIEAKLKSMEKTTINDFQLTCTPLDISTTTVTKPNETYNFKHKKMK